MFFAFANSTNALSQTAASQTASPQSSGQIGPGGRPVGEIWSRSPVYAEHGMAATAHPLASQVAIDILKAGGNAVDAAIAANAAIGLMEPTGNGIGGDLFAIIWDPETEKLYGLNASGRSPMAMSYDGLIARLDGRETIPPFSDIAVSVPGTVDGWFEMHDRFGKLSMRKILAPAIAYGEDGFPVSPVIAHYFGRNLARFERELDTINEFDNARATYFAGGPPKTGQVFKNPGLARTYRTLSRKGRNAFYKGEIARTMDAYMKRIGGALRYEDFAAHESTWVEPGCVDYRGYELCELPPNGQGFAALQMANILKNVELAQWPRGSAEVLHYITEAKRLAFEDLGRYYADPDFADIPVQQLLSDEYGRERFALIDPDRANPEPAPGDLELEGEGDTTYLTVADKSGMMVSLIQSNYRGMGTGLVPDGLGFMLQNRGELFSLDPDHPNVYEPGKRPFTTIIPAFIRKDGKPYISFGLMGGGMQPQGHIQILVNVVDYGMNLQEAGDAARLNHVGGRAPTGRLDDEDVDLLGTLHVEPGISPATVEQLRAKGHNVEVVENGIMFGGYQAILRNPETGVYTGATEMRKDGLAIGY